MQPGWGRAESGMWVSVGVMRVSCGCHVGVMRVSGGCRLGVRWVSCGWAFTCVDGWEHAHMHVQAGSHMQASACAQLCR